MLGPQHRLDTTNLSDRGLQLWALALGLYQDDGRTVLGHVLNCRSSLPLPQLSPLPTDQTPLPIRLGIVDQEVSHLATKTFTRLPQCIPSQMNLSQSHNMCP